MCGETYRTIVWCAPMTISNSPVAPACPRLGACSRPSRTLRTASRWPAAILDRSSARPPHARTQAGMEKRLSAEPSNTRPAAGPDVATHTRQRGGAKIQMHRVDSEVCLIRKDASRAMGSFWRDRRGVAAMEFVLVAPVLLMIIFGGAELAIALNRYMTLTNAAIVGAKQLAFSAGISATPYTDAVNAIQGAASSLNPPLDTSKITLSVNGTACNTDAVCGTALQPGTGFATASVTYSCTGLNMFFNLLPGCTMSSQQTERVQ
jgi:Flp pilus assembly protein TadG